MEAVASTDLHTPDRSARGHARAQKAGIYLIEVGDAAGVAIVATGKVSCHVPVRRIPQHAFLQTIRCATSAMVEKAAL